MAWVRIVPPAEADAALAAEYDRVKAPDGSIDSVMAVHSLRPHTLAGHMALYRATLHNRANTVPKWFLEALGVWVSILNGCRYCEVHHLRGLRRLLRDDARADALHAALAAGDTDGAPLSAAERAAMAYARRLTRDPSGLTRADADALRDAGWDDGRIVEINQVCAYFAYANRTVLGLGGALDEDGGGG